MQSEYQDYVGMKWKDKTKFYNILGEVCKWQDKKSEFNQVHGERQLRKILMRNNRLRTMYYKDKTKSQARDEFGARGDEKN